MHPAPAHRSPGRPAPDSRWLSAGSSSRSPPSIADAWRDAFELPRDRSDSTLPRMPDSSVPRFIHRRHALLRRAVLAAACVSAACGSRPTAAPAASADAWAVVDGREIKRDDVEKAYRRTRDTSQTLSEEEALTAKLNILNDLIVQDILLAKAAAL